MDEYKLVTPEQLKLGWTELRGSPLRGAAVVIHHEYIVVRQLESGNYVVRAPKVEDGK